MTQFSPMIRGTVLVLCATVSARAPCLAQEASAQGSFRSETIDITATPSSGAKYKLDILLPPEHDSSATGLPVLYYLDAWWWGGLMESLTRLAALASPPRIEPVILVGISVRGDADEFNRARNKDFTPSPYRPIAPGVTMRTGNVELDSAGTGGAREFLEFLEREIIPAVERRYNVQAEARGIAGHSYGGLFAAWTLAHRPELFRRMLVISPATYWNESETLDQGVLGDDQSSAAHRVFIAAGGREMAIMRRSAQALKIALETRARTEIEYSIYEGADHLTVLPAALLDGLTYLYGR